MYNRRLDSNKFIAIIGVFAYLILSLPKITQAASFSFSPSVLPGASQQISILGSTVKIKGLTDQTNKVLINGWEIPIQKDGSFQEEVIIPLGETEVAVTVIDNQGNSKTCKKKILAKEKYFFLAGIADGTLNVVDADTDVEWRRDNSHFAKGTHWDGKISYYLVAKIKGKYLIKSSLDTDKSTQEKLFSNIDPNEYYPLYGDNSTVVYDVNSQGKFYLLVEWNKSGFTFGNYQTQFDETKLAQYNRTLYGTKLNLESKENTLYGEPTAKLTGFIAEQNQFAGHSEFLATGGSLYYLRHRSIIEGSEQVKIEVRDKNSGMAVYSVPQKENLDYEIKYDEGRIIFKRPVLSVASSDGIISNSILEGNPVYITVNYEYKSQEAFPVNPEDLDRRTAGIRVAKALGSHIRLGATYVQETKTAQRHNLLGEDLTVKLGNFTKLEAEFATTESRTMPGYFSYNGGFDFISFSQDEKARSDARSFRLESSLGEYLGLGKEFLEFSCYQQTIGRNFSSTDTLSQAGTEKQGVELAHKLTENDRLRFLASREEVIEGALNQAAINQAQATQAKIYASQWIHTLQKWTFTSEFQQKETAGSYISSELPTLERSFAERAGYNLNPNAQVFLGQQFTFTGKANNQSSLGLVTRLSGNTQMQAQTAFGNKGNSVLLGLAKDLNETTSTYMNYSINNSRIDGKSSITASGSNTKVGADAKFRSERQFITSDLRGVYASNLMGLDYQATPRLNLGLTYQRRQEQVEANLIASLPRDSVSVNSVYAKPDKSKLGNKFEFREDTDGTQQVLTDNSGELKLTQDIFLSGDYQYSLVKRIENKSYAKFDIRQVGFAFRPVAYDWFNCLFKYTKMIDQRPENLTSADGGFVKMNTSSDVYASEFALDLPFHFQLVEKAAYKDEDAAAYDILGIIKTPENLKAQLFVHRLNYHLTKQWDIICEYRMLTQKGSDAKNREKGFFFEVSRKVIDNLYAGIGCNFTSFTDDLTKRRQSSDRGFFFRLQGRH